jgi:sensor c-di-GMP phosphodiesterase-like protein
MDLVSVAEGVETEEQAARLRELGVQLLQGYHFSRPLPVDQLDAWLKARPPASQALSGAGPGQSQAGRGNGRAFS